MAWRIMEVIDWTALAVQNVNGTERDRMDAFSLIGSIKSRGGSERDACEAVKSMLARRYPPQEHLPLPE